MELYKMVAETTTCMTKTPDGSVYVRASQVSKTLYS